MEQKDEKHKKFIKCSIWQFDENAPNQKAFNASLLSSTGNREIFAVMQYGRQKYKKPSHSRANSQ